MKTIKEWYKSVADPDIRQKLLNNMYYGIERVDSLHRAIDQGMIWGPTPEGFGYWSDIYKKAKYGNLTKKPLNPEIIHRILAL